MTTVSSATSGSGVLQSYIDKQAALASTSTATTTDTQTALQKATADYDTFLKILTAQLTNQDPLSAVDTNQFTQELVQFSAVEQQLATNSKLDTLIANSHASGTQALLSYLGKYVEVPTTDQLIVQNGSAQMGYSLDKAAKSVTIDIYNSEGDKVSTLNGSTTEGLNRILWDGSLTDGTTAASGNYTFKISAVAEDGTKMTVSDTRLIGIVTGMSVDATNGNQLTIGNIKISDTDIDAVFENFS
ncbi:MAG: flagellar hook capping FlgD N-terminal domain-containing protein [Alphaproteobacteria bacterium]|nr:flagellar hook capping FlgD N-terminal domain-containing protein [Alphaproteobacteria bacterium]